MESSSNSIDIFMPDRAILSLFKKLYAPIHSIDDGKEIRLDKVRCPPDTLDIFLFGWVVLLHMLKYPLF
jgi:hypothetical protein